MREWLRSIRNHFSMLASSAAATLSCACRFARPRCPDPDGSRYSQGANGMTFQACLLIVRPDAAFHCAIE